MERGARLSAQIVGGFITDATNGDDAHEATAVGDSQARHKAVHVDKLINVRLGERGRGECRDRERCLLQGRLTLLGRHHDLAGIFRISGHRLPCLIGEFGMGDPMCRHCNRHRGAQKQLCPYQTNAHQ